MENMERFTPLYAIMNSMENLCFGKEDYFHILVFLYTSYFIKEIENIPPMFPYSCRNTCTRKFGRIRNCMETLALWAHVPTSISCSPKLPLVFL